MTVRAELNLQKTAKRRVVELLRTQQAPTGPDELVRFSAVSKSPIPAYAIKRAVWSLVVDGKAEFTSDNDVRLIGR